MIGKFVSLVTLSVLICGSGLAQKKSDYLALWKNGQYEQLRNLLPELQHQYPNSDEIDYLQVLLETDGQLALKKGQNFIKENPHSEFVPEVQFRIAQYFYVQGIYIGAKDKFVDIVCQFPSSEIAEGAIYYSARCWAAVGSLDSARQVLQAFLHAYPHSIYATWARLDLQRANVEGNGQELLEGLSSKTSALPIYVVQIGAFAKRENALSLKRAIQQKGYPTKVQNKTVGGRKYYVVWVGEFPTVAEAQKVGEKLGVPFRVVEKTNCSP